MTSDYIDIDQASTASDYACIRTGGDEYIIYDQQNPAAWIVSDTTASVTGST